MSKHIRKLIMAFGLVAILASTAVVADDNELESKSNTTTNPFTGTVTNTKKHHEKRTNADGTTSTVESKKTKKYKTDGSTETKTEESKSSE